MSLERLGLPPEATVEEVKRRYKQLAMANHPDRGGNSDDFNRLQKYYQAALLEAQEPLRCEHCYGTGKTWQGRGFQRLAMSCMACGGAGWIQR